MDRTTTGGGEWLTVSQLREYLQVAPSTAYRLVSSGRVPTVKIGRVYRVNRAALDKKLEEGLI